MKTSRSNCLLSATFKRVSRAAAVFAIVLSLGAPSDASDIDFSSDWRYPLPYDEQFVAQQLRSYGIAAPNPPVRIIRNSSFNVIRVEHDTYCVNRMCLTLVSNNCRNERCQFTAIFAEDRVLAEYMKGVRGANLVMFPLKHDQVIKVLVKRDLVAVWSGFGFKD